jgi:hypothetical protein
MKQTEYLEPEIEEYLLLKKRSTANVYRSNLRIFVEYYQSIYGKDKTISDFLDTIFDELKKPRRQQRRITEIVLAGFIKHLQEKGMANNTIRSKFAAVQNFIVI